MKQVPSDNCNIAWFKLAECVARGEKERALNVYRLLSHSIEDSALAYQLEGDILSSFNDDDALDRYRQAAHMYQDAGQFLEAAAVYEKLLILTDDNISYAQCLISIYKELNLSHKAAQWLYFVLMKYLDDKILDKAIRIVEQLEDLDEKQWSAQAHVQVIWVLLEDDHIQSKKVMHYIKKALDDLIALHDNQQLQKLLSQLKALHTDFYHKACAYMEDDIS